MPRFRKRPVEIEAWQWNGEAYESMLVAKCEEMILEGAVAPPPWIFEAFQKWPELGGMEQQPHFEEERGTVDGTCLVIYTLAGVVKARPGDWIMKNEGGELYPCMPDTFRQNYESAELLDTTIHIYPCPGCLEQLHTAEIEVPWMAIFNGEDLHDVRGYKHKVDGKWVPCPVKPPPGPEGE